MKLTVGSKNFIHFIPESGQIVEQATLDCYCAFDKYFAFCLIDCHLNKTLNLGLDHFKEDYLWLNGKFY